MESIFISIASYRDTLCTKTLESIYENAKYPSRIFVGICQQNNEDDMDCLPENFPYRQNIQIIRLKDIEAKGPTWARYLCSKLVNGQDYFMQIDSHTLFAKDWDEMAINMIKSVQNSSENKKVLLSHYPPDYDDVSNNSEYVTNIEQCAVEEKSGIISFKGAKWKKKENLPTRNFFIAAGFIFVPAEWLNEVPYDPNLEYLFQGEEILLSARSFTNGWDVYTPNDNIVFHKYNRQGYPRYWNDHNYSAKDAQIKTKVILGLDNSSDIQNKNILNNIDKYGLGNIRSIDDFYDFIGFDRKENNCKAKTIESYSNTMTAHGNNGYYILVSTVIIFLLIILILLYRFGCPLVYVIFFLIIVIILAIVVILPINKQN
jgi:hypothetical protein